MLLTVNEIRMLAIQFPGIVTSVNAFHAAKCKKETAGYSCKIVAGRSR